jgi:uncharacterized protein (TIGR00730 family)
MYKVAMTEIIEKEISNICVFCGSAGRVADEYRNAATETGRMIGRTGYSLVYGGSNFGLMGLVADGAIEAGAKTIGVIPAHLQHKEGAHLHLDELHVVETMHQRKTMMVDKSDAFLILPGGFGSMDEFFEIMTWRQIGLHKKPIIIVNVSGYWDALVELMNNIVAAGFARESDKNLVLVAKSVEEAFEMLKLAPVETEDPKTKWM